MMSDCCSEFNWDLILRLKRSLLLWCLLRILLAVIGEPFDVCALLCKI